MSNTALSISHITKKYRLYACELDRIKEAFHPFRKSYHRDFYALNDVSFDIKAGEKVGIIGANGAGKSTLLKIITGVLKQSEGQIIADGRIAALLELGAGFNPNYSGIENIKLNGTLMGYSDEEIEERMQKIIDFAEIGDFIDQPVRNYSSGMFVRLAFATQIFSEPDILIVDEALSVGDVRFQQKCYRAMESLMKDKTVILVTHDTAAVTRFCSRVVWINKGKVMYDGEVSEGLRKYKEFLILQAIENQDADGIVATDAETVEENKVDDTPCAVPRVPANINIIGNGYGHITHCGLLGKDGELTDIVEPGDEVDYVTRIVFEKEAERPIYGLSIRDRLGNDIIALNSETLGLQLPKGRGTVEYHMRFTVPELNRGNYVISVAVANGFQNAHVQYCWLDDVSVFSVTDRDYDVPGFIYMQKGQIDVNVISND